jgi:hypothetical protein
MAWSDAARRASALVRAARKKATYREGYRVYHTGNVGGKLVNTDRPSLARRIRAMRRGEAAPSTQVLSAARVSTDFRNYKRTGRASTRLKKAMSDSVNRRY